MVTWAVSPLVLRTIPFIARISFTLTGETELAIAIHKPITSLQIAMRIFL